MSCFDVWGCCFGAVGRSCAGVRGGAADRGGAQPADTLCLSLAPLLSPCVCVYAPPGICPKQTVSPDDVDVSNVVSVVQADTVERRRSERLLPKLIEVIQNVPAGWPYRDTIFTTSAEPAQALQLYRDLEWLVANGYISYQYIPQKQYHGVVALKIFEGRIGIMTGRPILGAQSEEAGVYSLCPVLGSDLAIEGGVSQQSRPYDGNLFNHSCLGQTVVPKRILLDGVPVVVFDTVGLLAEGQELVWDYNGGLKGGGYVLSRNEFLYYKRQGEQVQACRCAWPHECPKQRGLWL